MIQVGVLLGQVESVFVEIDGHHFLRTPQNLGMHRETPCVATKVQNATAGAKSGESLAVVTLIEKETGFVLTAGSDAKTHAVFRNNCGRRRLGRPAIKGFLFLNVFFREPIANAVGELACQDFLDDGSEAKHPGREKL